MDKATDLKERYGKRIQEIMMVPVIEDIYRKYKGNADKVEELAAAALITPDKDFTVF